MRLISTIITEIYNDKKVRIAYPPEKSEIIINEKNDDTYVIPPNTTGKVISIVNTNSNYLAIYTNYPIIINLNGDITGINVGIPNNCQHGHFVLLGTNINSLTITNNDPIIPAEVTVLVGNAI